MAKKLAFQSDDRSNVEDRRGEPRTVFELMQQWNREDPDGILTDALRGRIEKALQQSNYGNTKGSVGGTGKASPNFQDYQSNAGAVQRSRYFDKPMPIPYEDNKMRVGVDMRGATVIPPFNDMRADQMLDAANYARHPDAKEAITDTVTGIKTVPPPADEGVFDKLKSALQSILKY